MEIKTKCGHECATFLNKWQKMTELSAQGGDGRGTKFPSLDSPPYLSFHNAKVSDHVEERNRVVLSKICPLAYL